MRKDTHTLVKGSGIQWTLCGNPEAGAISVQEAVAEVGGKAILPQ